MAAAIHRCACQPCPLPRLNAHVGRVSNRGLCAEGLTHSLVFVPFVSRGALLNMASMMPPSEKGDAHASLHHLKSEERPFYKRLDPDTGEGRLHTERGNRTDGKSAAS